MYLVCKWIIDPFIELRYFWQSLFIEAKMLHGHWNCFVNNYLFKMKCAYTDGVGNIHLGFFYLECDTASVPMFWGNIAARPRITGFHLPYCENLRLTNIHLLLNDRNVLLLSSLSLLLLLLLLLLLSSSWLLLLLLRSSLFQEQAWLCNSLKEYICIFHWILTVNCV